MLTPWSRCIVRYLNDACHLLADCPAAFPKALGGRAAGWTCFSSIAVTRRGVLEAAFRGRITPAAYAKLVSTSFTVEFVKWSLRRYTFHFLALALQRLSPSAHRQETCLACGALGLFVFHGWIQFCALMVNASRCSGCFLLVRNCFR